jgi:hypothetical protein
MAVRVLRASDTPRSGKHIFSADVEINGRGHSFETRADDVIEALEAIWRDFADEFDHLDRLAEPCRYVRRRVETNSDHAHSLVGPDNPSPQMFAKVPAPSPPRPFCLGLVIRDIVGLVHVALELIQLGCKPDDEIGWHYAILTAAIRQASGGVCIVASTGALATIQLRHLFSWLHGHPIASFARSLRASGLAPI